MDELISKQALLNSFGLSEKTRKWGGDHSGYNTMMLYEIQDVIESQPSVNPQPKTAYWIRLNDYTDEKDKHKCSNCGFESIGATRFCPNCGMKMFKTGNWLFYGRLLKCSNCGYINDDILDECPNCKISMIEPQESEGKA